MNAGKSRFALLKEKNNVINDIIEIAREEKKIEEPVSLNEESTQAPQADATSTEAIEKPAAAEGAKPEEAAPHAETTSKKAIEKPATAKSAKSGESTAAIDDQKMSEYVNMFMKKIQESSDPRILKKHPQYKGVRYKRSYQWGRGVSLSSQRRADYERKANCPFDGKSTSEIIATLIEYAGEKQIVVPQNTRDRWTHLLGDGENPIKIKHFIDNYSEKVRGVEKDTTEIDI